MILDVIGIRTLIIFGQKGRLGDMKSIIWSSFFRRWDMKFALMAPIPLVLKKSRYTPETVDGNMLPDN